MDKYVQIAYSVHDDSGIYYEYLGISLVSVMENTNEHLRFHILCDETLTPKARDILRRICEGYGQEIVFYDITLDERIDTKELLSSGYCEGILYRLYLPQLLPEVSKLIYLDADIIAYGDVKNIWEFDVSKCCVAGRWDPPILGYKPLDEEATKKAMPFWESTDWNRYINSGVLVMNLDRIRKGHSLLEEAIDFWNRYGMMLPDQDAINFCFRDDKILLPIEFNLPNRLAPSLSEGYFYHYTYTMEMSDKLDPIDKLVLSYWEKTPFFDPGYGKKEKIQYLRRMKNRRAVYERIRKYCPLCGDEVLGYAESLFLDGDFEALRDYLTGKVEELLQSEGTAEGVHRSHVMHLNMAFYLARAYKELGEKEKAVEALKASVSYDKGSSYLGQDVREMEQRLMLGEAYYDNGQYEEARQQFFSCLYFGNVEKRQIAIRGLLRIIKCEIKMELIDRAKEHLCMLRSISPFEEETKLWKLQIEIAERKLKKQRDKDS